ncbi:MAG TPA: carbohydrate ABC transporter permease [Steroidobacteraceae bacterium]|nr:carbohydrate ABC transporter permease [Steroidobacteraceae bacterium]
MRRGRWLALVVVAGWCLAPFLWQVITSLKPAPELVTLPPLLPSRITFEHYAAVLASESFARVILNSAIVALATTLLALAVGTLAAFALSVLRTRGRRLILIAVLAISMFPPIATVSPLFLMLNALGLHDTLLALVITYTTFSLPLAIWLLANFFDALPRELYHAARIDGLSAFGALRHVILPLAAPGWVAAGLLVFIFSWNEFLFALSFTATDASRTIPVAIALFPGLHEIPYGEIAAASVIVTVPVVLLAFVFERRIVAGLTAGAVKG